MSVALDTDALDTDGAGGIGERFDPLGEAYLADPYPYLSEAREAAPAFYSRRLNHWVLTRYHDVRRAFLTPQVFSAVNANSPVLPPCPRAARALEEGGYRAVPVLANVDPPVHARYRRMANTAFTPRRVAELEGFVRGTVARFCEERFDAGRRDADGIGRADMVRDLAWELPVLVLFRILGIPDDQVPRIKEGSWNRILFVYGRPRSEDDQVRAAEGLSAFWRYAEELVAARTREPGDDFVSALVQARDEAGEGMTPQQAATVVLNLLFAGHETTTGLLGNAFRRLLDHRASWDAVRADPALIPNALEEVLRLDSSVIAWRRRTTQATEVGGVPVPAGANVLLLMASANRDPDVFPDPDRFDIHRANARQHLSFGYGVHLCLGRLLALMQARVAVEEVSARFPGLRLAPDAVLQFPPNVSFRGPLSLPVLWDAA